MKKGGEKIGFLGNYKADLAFVSDMKACTDLKFKILMMQYCEAMSQFS